MNEGLNQERQENIIEALMVKGSDKAINEETLCIKESRQTEDKIKKKKNRCKRK